MQYFVAAIETAGILLLAGAGFTLFLLPDQFRKYTLLVAPWVGYCYTSLTCWYVYRLGAVISRRAAVCILVPPVLAFFAFFFKKRARGFCKTFTCGPVLIALGLAATGLFVLSIPLFSPGSGLTSVSLFCHDIAHYASVSRFLSDFGRTSTSGFVGQIDSGFVWLADNNYFGPPAFAAFISGILGLMPHQVLTLCINLLTALTAAALFLPLHDVLKLPPRTALLGVGLVAFHPLANYVALQGFFAQVGGMGLALMVFWSNAKLLDKEGAVGRDWIQHLILLTLFTCGLLLTYQHMVLFIWLFVALYAAAFAWMMRDWRILRTCAVVNLAALALSGALCPHRIMALITIVRNAAILEAGWFVPFISIDFLLGLSYQNAPYRFPPERLHVTLATIASLIVLGGITLLWKRSRNGVLAFLIACGVIYAGCFWLGLRGSYNGSVGGYKSFKLVSFFLPFFASVVACGFGLKTLRGRAWAAGLKTIALVAISYGYLLGDMGLIRAVRAAKRVEPEYRDLLSIDRNKQINSVNILGSNGWVLMWEAYFLMHKSLYMENVSYYGASPLTGKYDLVDAVMYNSEVLHVGPARRPPAHRINDRFTLFGPVLRTVSATLGPGWYPGEAGHVWLGKIAPSAALALRAYAEETPIALNARVAPSQQDDAIAVTCNGRTISPDVTIIDNVVRHITIPRLVLHQGSNEVTFTTTRKAVPPNASGPWAPFEFSAIEIDEF